MYSTDKRVGHTGRPFKGNLETLSKAETAKTMESTEI